MKTAVAAALLLAAIVVLGLWEWSWDSSLVGRWIDRHPLLGAGAYFLLVAGSVVLLPFSSLPLLPLATQSYGVWTTALLSAAGWWAGCLAAFQIARFGRRYLERVASLAAVDRLEERIPADIGFGGIVVLRLILPVDIVSFALGLLRHLEFRTYAVASLVGIVPFAFVWSFAGGELGAGRFLSFALVVLAMAGALLLGRRWWLRRR